MSQCSQWWSRPSQISGTAPGRSTACRREVSVECGLLLAALLVRTADQWGMGLWQYLATHSLLCLCPLLGAQVCFVLSQPRKILAGGCDRQNCVHPSPCNLSKLEGADSLTRTRVPLLQALPTPCQRYCAATSAYPQCCTSATGPSSHSSPPQTTT